MEWDKNKKIFLEIICIVCYFSFAIGMSWFAFCHALQGNKTCILMEMVLTTLK